MRQLLVLAFAIASGLAIAASVGFLQERTKTADLEHVLGNTHVQLERARDNRDAAQARNEALEAVREQQEQELAETREENASAGRAYGRLEQRYGALEQELAETREEHASIGLAYGRLEQRYEALEQQVGDIEMLKAQTDALRKEIAELQAARAPLVPSDEAIRRSGFSCTGSMEPTITCLDEATWLYDFEPADVVVGAVIIFTAGSCWPDSHTPDGWVSHRVMDIKHEGGAYYFWPQGDSNDEPDGCWVHEQHIKAYVTQLHRNVVPENAPLRDGYNSARTRWQVLREEYEILKALYEGTKVQADQVETQYWDLIEEICGERYPEVCNYGGRYDEANAAWLKVEEAYERVKAWYATLLGAYERQDAALARWNCWRENVEAGELLSDCRDVSARETA